MSHLSPALSETIGATVAALIAAALWTGCTTDPGPDVSQPPLFVPSRMLSVPENGVDTAVTLFRYDSSGFLTREIRGTTLREWDSLGRYQGVRYKDSAVYVERVEWIGADSAIRTQGTSLVIQERFFNPRPNCWCADSIRHNLNGTLVTRKFLYDAVGNPLQVQLVREHGTRIETVQFYQNTYDDEGRLSRVVIQDMESGSLQVTTRLIEYDTLKNLVEPR